MMVDNRVVNQVIEYLLEKIETTNQEIGRILVRDEFEPYEQQITLWAIRKNIRDLKETTVTDLDINHNIEVKITYAPPNFFSDVLEGKNVPYWQIATVIRLLRNSKIVFDPQGKMEEWINQAPNIEWNAEVIELKQKTAQMLLNRMQNRIHEDMLADAYIWLLKAAEEAICVPLMIKNAFDIGTPALMLESLREHDNALYSFFAMLLQIQNFSFEKLEKARKELENLADHLYQKNIKTNREMWILAAFVSINESEKRLKQSIRRKKKNPNDHIINKLFDAAVGELWQAFFLVAQNPRLEVKLDPWVVGSFWNYYGSPRIDEKWLMDQAKKVEEIINV